MRKVKHADVCASQKGQTFTLKRSFASLLAFPSRPQRSSSTGKWFITVKWRFLCLDLLSLPPHNTTLRIEKWLSNFRRVEISTQQKVSLRTTWKMSKAKLEFMAFLCLSGAHTKERVKESGNFVSYVTSNFPCGLLFPVTGSSGSNKKAFCQSLKTFLKRFQVFLASLLPLLTATTPSRL